MGADKLRSGQLDLEIQEKRKMNSPFLKLAILFGGMLFLYKMDFVSGIQIVCTKDHNEVSDWACRTYCRLCDCNPLYSHCGGDYDYGDTGTVSDGSCEVRCKVDCQWSNWSKCSKTCGTGKKTRTIQIPPQNGGKECSGPSQENCNTQSCVTQTGAPQPQVGAWNQGAAWNQQPQLCSTNYYYTEYDCRSNCRVCGYNCDKFDPSCSRRRRSAQGSNWNQQLKLCSTNYYYTNYDCRQNCRVCPRPCNPWDISSCGRRRKSLFRRSAQETGLQKLVGRREKRSQGLVCSNHPGLTDGVCSNYCKVCNYNCHPLTGGWGCGGDYDYDNQDQDQARCEFHCNEK